MRVQAQNRPQHKRKEDRASYLKPNEMIKFATDCILIRI